MQEEDKQVKIQQEFTCPTCGKIFNFAQQLKIHQFSKHKILTQQSSHLNEDSSNEQQKPKKLQSINERRRKTRQRKKAQQDLKNNLSSKLIEQKDENESQSHSENNQSQNSQPAIVIPQPPPVTPTDDIYQKIYLCGCNNKFFEQKEELSLHIKKQHLGFPPDGTLIGVSKQLVMKQFKPIQGLPKHAYKEPSNTKIKHSYRFICGCGAKFTQFEALGFHIKKKHNGIQPEFTIGGLFRPPLDITEDDQGQKGKQLSQSSNNQAPKDARKICSFCRSECTGRILVCRDCQNWKFCGKCHLGALSRQKHVQSGHRLYTI